MSIKVQSWVYQHSEARGNERLVLLAIADEANDDGTNAHPGIKTIAHKARINERTTMRCLDRLEADGRLIVNRPEKSGRGKFNTYIVVMEEPTAASEKPVKLSPTPDDSERQDEPPPEPREKVTEDRASPRSYVGNRGRPTNPQIQSQNHPPLPPESVPMLELVPPPLAAGAAESDFDRWWDVFPAKHSKGAARTAWPRALKKVGGDAERLIDAARRFRDDPNRTEPYTPYPATWLNGERWDDDPLPSKLANGTNGARPIHRPLDTDRTGPSGRTIL